MRLFTAIRFGPATRSRLADLTEELRRHSQRGRFTAPENLHLTLVFLGECNERQVSAAKKAMDQVDFDAVPLLIHRLGTFRRNRRDLWWAGVEENHALAALQKDLRSHLMDAGFALADRRYEPHITLGREILTEMEPWVIEPFGEAVACIELMKSEQLSGRLTYTPIHRKQSR